MKISYRNKPITKEEQVDYLIQRKYAEEKKIVQAELGTLTIPKQHNLFGGTSKEQPDLFEGHPKEKERVEKAQAIIDAYRVKLSTMTVNDRHILYKQEKEKESREKTEAAKREEANRFYNQPETQVDFLHWSKLEYWTLNEVIALILRKNPEKVSWEKLKEYVNTSNPASPFIEKYVQVRDLVLRKWHDSSASIDKASPSEYLAWARSIDLDVPHELAELVEKYKRKNPFHTESADANTAKNDKNIDSPDPAPPKSKLEQRIDAIMKIIHDWEYDPLCIPYRGKAKIESKCLENTDLFNENSFKKAWQAARNHIPQLIEVANSEIYKNN